MAMAGMLFSAIGTVAGVIGSFSQTAAMNKAEQLREQQMNLEADRRRREAIRQATVARATATSSATAQGAQTSSSLAGGLSQITNQASRNIQATNQDQALGHGIFQANRDYADASGLIAIGQGVSSLSGMFSGNADTFARWGWT